MQYKYAVNIHVIDKNDVPVAGAVVTILSDGKPIAKGPTSGYINSPLKLRFNTDALRVGIRVEYEGKLFAEREIAVTDRDATFTIEELEMPSPNTNSIKVHPDLIDAFIIITLATALDIFIFFMATQFINNPVFQHLPSFVTNTYQAIWTSAVSGAAGIGAAIVKALTRKAGQQTPNYLAYVLGTAVLVFALIVGLAYASSRLSPVRSADAPNIQATYQVCVGEHQEQCPAGAVYLYCGASVAAWAKKECSSYVEKQIWSRDGNKCGYSLVQITCKSAI